MTVIQIKRSTGSTAPTTSDLAEGELAYAEDRSVAVPMPFFTLNQ